MNLLLGAGGRGVGLQPVPPLPGPVSTPAVCLGGQEGVYTAYFGFLCFFPQPEEVFVCAPLPVSVSREAKWGSPGCQMLRERIYF